MKYELRKLDNLSGSKASVYSPFIEEEGKTLFDIFLEENISSFKSELNDIYSRIHTIGHKVGAREQFFKLKEGKPGDGVCALYDNPDKNLRLYCIRYGLSLVILGGGGYKSKDIRKLQEDPKLKKENYLLKEISESIKEKSKFGEIKFVSDGMDFEGDLTFNDENYE
ncbi:MAG: hypothetical protein WBG43_05990 [Marinifilaceae bacterium]